MRTPWSRTARTVAVAACFWVTSVAHAQAPAGSDTLSRRAVAESLKVLDQLGTFVKANPKDAAAWFHRAMVAFVLAERAGQKDVIPGLQKRQMRIYANDAFVEARNLDFKNNAYKHAFNQFKLTDSSAIVRAGGRPRNCDVNLAHYDNEPDLALRLTLIIDMGWICWMDYDGYENRALSSFSDPLPRGMIDEKKHDTSAPGEAAPKSVTESAARGILREAVDACSGTPVPIPLIQADAIYNVLQTLAPVPFEVAGETDYLRAKVLFEAAYKLAPGDPRSFSSLAMLLAARDNWTELISVAREQTRVVPDDEWGWMALALGTYRAHPGKEAAALFDSAFARLDPKDQTRLNRLDRVLRRTDSLQYSKMSADERAAAAQTSWMLADPLWSAPNADPRTEFLARVTYAELRWTLNGWSTHGADTDRGDIYIRYGPPNKIVGFQPAGTAGALPPPPIMYTFWVYNANLIFEFDKFLHRGRAEFDKCDAILVDRVEQWQPARWDNIADARIDSMPTQVARFRAEAGAIDVYLAAQAPVAAMRELTVANVNPVTHVWFLPRGPGDQYVDSSATPASGLVQLTRRVEPGAYYYRVETMIPGTLVAGRTTATISAGRDTLTGFSTIGFGLSDILVATRAVPRALPKRWRDVDVTPLLGSVPRGSEIALVWENYELGKQSAGARYDVAISVEREVAKSGAIAAKITGLLAGAVRTTSTKDKLLMRIERTVPHDNVITDNITLALGTTPAGTYRLTVQVTDRTSGRTASRTTRVTIEGK